MKQELKEYIYANPNTWARYLSKKPEFVRLIDSIDAEQIAEKAFIAVYGKVEHNCQVCGKTTLFENFMKGYRPFCSTTCNQISKTRAGDESLLAKIAKLDNFELLSGIVKGGKFGRKLFTVRNKKCNHTFEVNNLDLFTNPDNYCSVCGPKTRQKKLTDANVERKSNERKQIMLSQKMTFNQYSKLVRTLTRKVYIKHSSIINPSNLRISKYDYHLDHIVSIFDGWKNNIDARMIASIVNLQVIPANANLQKSSKSEIPELELMIFNSKWIEQIKNIDIDEIQFTPTIISCNNGKLGIALPQRTNKEAEIQNNFKNTFDRYVFFGELHDTAIINRFTYWNNLKTEKINARDCQVVELKAYECRKFLDMHHSQGFLVAKVYLGLQIDGRLVSVMTFGTPRFAKKYQWELLRFCSAVNVRGAASKLFSYFKNKFIPSSVISYSNKSYGSGNIYSILGFKFTHDTPPTEWYYSPTDPCNIIRMSSYKYSSSEDYADISSKYVRFSNKGNSVYALITTN